MANDFKDLIRYFDTPAALAANLKEKQKGYDNVNDRISLKLPGGALKHWSDDTKQVLIEGTQTINGSKTFLLNILMSSGKLLSLDSVGGIRLVDGEKITISPDDTAFGGYTSEELLSIFSGNFHVQDRSSPVGGNFINDGGFDSSSLWVLVGGFTIGSGSQLGYNFFAGSSEASQISENNKPERMYPNTWCKFTYDVVFSSFVGVLSLSSETSTEVIVLDTSVGNGKEVYFKSTNESEAPFKIEVTSAVSGNFALDNFVTERFGGTVEGEAFGPGGALRVTGRGDMKSIPPGVTTDRSGYFSGPDPLFLRGLQFNDLSDARITERLDIGGGQGVSPNPFTEGTQERWTDSNRISIDTTRTATTLGTTTSGTVDFDIGGSVDDGVSTYLVFVNGLKTDLSASFSAIYHVAVRSDGGTRTILGQSQLSFFNDIDGASGSINFSIGSGNLTAYLPGLIGHDVNWTLQYMGHGNQFGDRKV
jgi:hypothetical protein